jgi:hypothetical protein
MAQYYIAGTRFKLEVDIFEVDLSAYNLINVLQKQSQRISP